MALAVAAAPGCAGRLTDASSERGDAELDRLAETARYVLPSEGSVTFFTCRFRTDVPVLVSLPPEASEAEASALRAALGAWEGAGLGVRFVEVTPGAPASIGLSFAPAGHWDEPGHTGLTRADCRLRGAAAAEPLDAEIVYARIQLSRRTPRDWRDRDRPLTAGELTGAAAHELGHALGLPGHPARSGSVMVRNREEVARIGAGILAGDLLRESALRALYALPSGAIIRRDSVSPVRTELADRLAALARAQGLAGPFARTGDRSARLFFVPGPGEEAGLGVPDLAALWRRPERLVLLPDARAKALLDAAP